MILSLIVVTHNSSKDIGPLIESLLQFEPKIKYELIIVDNHSNDNSVEIIKSFPSSTIKLLDRKERNGFGNNCNYGFERANGEIIAFINPDVVFIEDGIDQLVEYLKNSEYGILGPRLLNSDYSIQFSARRFLSVKILISRVLDKGKDHLEGDTMKRYFYNGLSTDKVIDVDWVTGAAMFIKRKVLDDLQGGFDEIYRMYVEDQDLCFMAKVNGWKTGYYPHLKMLHHHQRTSVTAFSKKTRYHLTGYLIFFYKRLFSIKRRLAK